MQYTLRHVPEILDAAIRRRAAEENRSINDVAIEALLQAFGLTGVPSRQRDLGDVAGRWHKDAASDRALAEQRPIDPEMWK